MRGQIELYHNFGGPNEELLHKESNVIVDGAGELIADIMTYPTPSLSGNSELSSILDASNYTVQALSFGKAAPNFDKHAHHYPSSLSNSSTIISFQSSGDPVIILAPYTNSGQDYYDTSAYPGGTYLPSFPSPYDTLLQEGSVPPLGYSLSGLFPHLADDIGHNLNMVAYRDSLDLSALFLGDMPDAAASSAYFEGVGSSTDAVTFSAVTKLGGSSVWFGCFPDGSGTGKSVSAYLVSGWDNIGDGGVGIEDITSSAHLSGIINTVSSMDIFGFMGLHYCVSGNIAPAETNPASGLVISAGLDEQGSSVAYMTTVGSGDVAMANLYGGINSLGLWGLDIARTMQAAKKVPPIEFNPLNNFRKYKLFSKKVFNENICRISLTSNLHEGHNELTIVWRLYF